MTNTSNPQVDNELREILTDMATSYAAHYRLYNESNSALEIALEEREADISIEDALYRVLKYVSAHTQAAVDAAGKELAERIVSNSRMGTGSLHGGKDTFTINKQTLWQLVQLQSKKGNNNATN